MLKSFIICCDFFVMLMLVFIYGVIFVIEFEILVKGYLDIEDIILM